MTVLSVPPWKMEYSGVRQHRCSSALDFCSAGSEWKELENRGGLDLAILEYVEYVRTVI